jgi:hypothetical protein
MTLREYIVSTFGIAVVITVLVRAIWTVILNRITASVKDEYDKTLAEHVNKLRRETDLVLKDFEAKANERSIKLSKTFDTQADVIVTIYQKLSELYDERNASIMFRPKSQDKLQESLVSILNKRRDFYDYYKKNKIYLPRKTATIIADCEKYMTAVHQQHEWNANDYQKADSVIKEKIALNDAWFKTVPEMLVVLEDELQSLLGFPPPESKNPPAKI